MSFDYPATLPRPTRSTHTADDRLFRSGGSGPQSQKVRQRDYSGRVAIEFFFTADQLATFYAWWQTDLKEGGYWFNAPWPNVKPGNMIAQFLGKPTFKHVYNGAARVSAEVQMRGAGLAVMPAYVPPVATVLTFEGTTKYYQINSFYGGGTDAGGASGLNYGVVFRNLNSAWKGDGNFSNNPSGVAAASLSSSSGYLNRILGFTALSFYYCSSTALTVTVTDATDGTGNILGIVYLPPQSSVGCNDTSFCNWSPTVVPFTGVAKSVQFSAGANRCAFDDISLMLV